MVVRPRPFGSAHRQTETGLRGTSRFLPGANCDARTAMAHRQAPLRAAMACSAFKPQSMWAIAAPQAVV